VKKEKRKTFSSLFEALEYIDKLAKQRPKVTGHLHTEPDYQWSVTYTKGKSEQKEE
jgi:hypothetical protein